MSILYRIIPLRMLRRTPGVHFDEMVPSDIPKIDGIDRVIHAANSISPGPVQTDTVSVKRPWYMHPGQDDNLMVLQGTRYIDIYNPVGNQRSGKDRGKMRNFQRDICSIFVSLSMLRMFTFPHPWLVMNHIFVSSCFS